MTRQKILAFLISTLPIAYIYAFPILINNLGNAILLFLIFPLLLFDYFEKKGKNQSVSSYISFCVYLIAISIFAPVISSFEGEAKELFSAIEFSVIMYFLITDRLLGKTFINVYTNAAIVFAVFLLIQYSFFVFFKINISGIIPFLSTYNREIESLIEGRILRISSVFAEPSHFAVYEIPALIMILWEKAGQNRRVFKIGLISVSILLSTSSNGIIVMLLSFFAFLVYKYFARLRFKYIVIGIIVLVAAVGIISSSRYLDMVTYGLFVQESDMTTSKAELRIYRGFNLYADLPVDKKIMGVGWRNAKNYCQESNPSLYNKYYITVFDYFNSIAGTLIYAGVIGLFFLLKFFYSLWKRTSDFATRTLVICVLAVMFSSSVLMSDQWVLFLATITSMINVSNNEKSNSNFILQRNSNS